MAAKQKRVVMTIEQKLEAVKRIKMARSCEMSRRISLLAYQRFQIG
jgi:hypothetical protein